MRQHLLGRGNEIRSRRRKMTRVIFSTSNASMVASFSLNTPKLSNRTWRKCDNFGWVVVKNLRDALVWWASMTARINSFIEDKLVAQQEATKAKSDLDEVQRDLDKKELERDVARAEAEGLKAQIETERLEMRHRLETDNGKDVRFSNHVNAKAFNLYLKTLKTTGLPFDHPAWKYFEWPSKSCAPGGRADTSTIYWSTAVAISVPLVRLQSAISNVACSSIVARPPPVSEA